MARSLANYEQSKRAENTKKFLEWHASLGKDEKTKFNRFVSETNRGKNIGSSADKPSKAAIERRRRSANGNRGNPNYRSSVGDGDGKLQRAIGDAFSKNNPKSAPNAAADGAEKFVKLVSSAFNKPKRGPDPTLQGAAARRRRRNR